MRTVQRIAFGQQAGGCDAKAVQMVGPFTFAGYPYPPGSWVVMYPGKREVVTDAQFTFRYREVECPPEPKAPLSLPSTAPAE